jgi:uncharacterized membrane protein (UPF0127 family)
MTATGAFRLGGLRLAFAALWAVLLFSASCGEGRLEHTDVRIGSSMAIRSEIAWTPTARTLGLGGREALDRNAGMLFVLPEEGRETFWMKGMRFPLDFAWISSDRRVLQLTEDVPPPEAGTPDKSLPLYKPEQPVRYVLEVNAGVTEALGISVGDEVRFEPEVDVGRAR